MEKVGNGLLRKISGEKFNLLLGEITSLMMVSKIHRQMQIRDIADIILPAINLQQYRIYRDEKGKPVGFVTWANFSQDIESLYLKGKVVLSQAELNSGEIIYITDFIAPYGHTKRIVSDLRKNIFPDKKVKALRFTEPGKHKSNIWIMSGKNTHRI